MNDLRQKFVDEFFAKAKADGNQVNGVMFNQQADSLYIEWLEKLIEEKGELVDSFLKYQSKIMKIFENREQWGKMERDYSRSVAINNLGPIPKLPEGYKNKLEKYKKELKEMRKKL